MKIIHFCAGLEPWNGMANTARQFVAEERAAGHDSSLTNDLGTLCSSGYDRLHVHGTWLPVLWKAVKRAKSSGAEVVLRPAGNYDPIRRRQGTWKRIKKLLAGPWEHAMLDRADRVQATCEAEAEWIRGYHPSARVELTDLTRFFRLDAPLRREAPEKDKGLNVLFLGRAKDPLKGVAYLERAVEELGRRTRPVSLHVVTDKSGEALEREWEWCDVLCLPTLSENFGRVVAEALERGRRVVTTDGAPAWEEYFAAHPEKGVYVRGYRDGGDEYRVQGLVKALEKCLS